MDRQLDQQSDHTGNAQRQHRQDTEPVQKGFGLFSGGFRISLFSLVIPLGGFLAASFGGQRGVL